MSKVSIVKKRENYYATFVKAIKELGIQPVTSGDHVLIKPNLVQPAAPDSGGDRSLLSGCWCKTGDNW